MLFYVALLIFAVVISFVILWLVRMVSASSNSFSTTHLSSKTQESIVREGVTRYAKASKRSTRRKGGKISKPSKKSDWGFNPNAGGYAVRNPSLNGQAYKPSARAVAMYALKTGDD
jgi:hypothetical protein